MLFSNRLIFALSCLGVAFALAASPAAAGGRSGGMQPPGDPDLAVEAEYKILSGKGTRAALELFIARHPDHPLAERARRALDSMAP